MTMTWEHTGHAEPGCKDVPGAAALEDRLPLKALIPTNAHGATGPDKKDHPLTPSPEGARRSGLQ